MNICFFISFFLHFLHITPETAMIIKYSIIGLAAKRADALITYTSNLKGYQLVGNAENPNLLFDIILAGCPDLIYVNVDRYSANDFTSLVNTINQLYRSPLQKPLLVALAPSDEQAYDCIKSDFFYYLLGEITAHQIVKLDYKLRSTHLTSDTKPKKLCLQTYRDYRFIEISDILFLKADSNATEFFMCDKTKITAFKTLKYFESILPETFSRIHQSFVINQKYISRIHFGKSECYLKTLKTRLPFSKSYRNVMTELALGLSSNALT